MHGPAQAFGNCTQERSICYQREQGVPLADLPEIKVNSTVFTRPFRGPVAVAASSTDRIMREFQRRFDRPLGADDFKTELFQFLAWQLSDHGGHNRLAPLEGAGNTGKLSMTKGVLWVEGTIFLNLDFVDQLGVVLAVLEDAKFFGVTEVLIDFGARFGCDGDKHDDLLYSY